MNGTFKKLILYEITQTTKDTTVFIFSYLDVNSQVFDSQVIIHEVNYTVKN